MRLRLLAHALIAASVFGLEDKSRRTPIQENLTLEDIQDEARELKPFVPLPKDNVERICDFEGGAEFEPPEEALPFGDGPGTFPPYLEATKAFWEGTWDPETGDPLNIWEVLACPVIDPPEFLREPARCFAGDVPDPSLASFFTPAFDEDFLQEALEGVIAPIAANFIIRALLPTPFFNFILNPICQVADFFGLLPDDPCDDFFDDPGCPDGLTAETPHTCINTFLPETPETCSGKHLESSSCGITNDEKAAVCDACALDKNAICPSDCATCYRPNPDQIGICVSTNCLPARKSQSETLNFFEAMEMNQVVYSSRIMAAFKEELKDNERKLLQDETNIPKRSSSRPKKDHVRKLAAKNKRLPPRMNAENADKLFSELLQSIKELNVEDQVLNEIKPLLESKEFTDRLQHRMMTAFANGEKPALEMAQKVMKILRSKKEDPEGKEHDQGETAKVDENFRKLLTKKSASQDPDSFQFGSDQFENAQSPRRNLLFTPSEARCCPEDDHDICDNFIDLILPIEDVVNLLSDVISGLISDIIGSGGFFSEVLQFFQDRGINGNGPIGFVLPFVKIFDPWIEDSVVGGINRIIISIFQESLATLVYDCDGDDACVDENIRSRGSQIVKVKETRDGKVYSAGGCDGEFLAELAWYGPVFSVVDSLLENAKDTVLEFVNLPITFVRFCLASTQRTLQHMQATCDYLGGFAAFARSVATLENSRLIYQSTKCREVETLLSGHGCDGIDSDCDLQIDECDEDQIPPVIDLTAVKDLCGVGKKIFKNIEEARACVEEHVVATDDCRKDVRLEVVARRVREGTCVQSIRVTATALGCQGPGRDASFDVTSEDVPVEIDGEKPEVECSFGIKQHYSKHKHSKSSDKHPVLKYSQKGLEDVKFAYSVMDNCPGDLEVEIEVLSTEKEATRIMSLWATSEDSVDEDSPPDCLFLSPRSCYPYGDCAFDLFPCEDREYLVRVKATDRAGNVGVGACEIPVVRYKSKKSKGRHRKKSPFDICDKKAYYSGKGQHHHPYDGPPKYVLIDSVSFVIPDEH